MTRQQPRIRVRLTILYAGSMLLLLLGAAAVTRDLLHRELDREFNASLRASSDLVHGFFRAELREHLTIPSTLEHITSEFVFADRRITFVDPDGEAYRVPAMLPSRVETPLVPPLVSHEAPLDRDLAPGWTMRITASAAGLGRHRKEVNDDALLAIPIAVVCAIAVGWWLVGRTLRPVALMADAASRISASQPGQRLPIRDPNDELGRLGQSFNAVLDRLDSALGQQRQFLADAAHELRAPLARARSAIEAAAASGAVEAQREAAALVTREIAAMASLVDELLQLARADADVRQATIADGFLDDVAADALGAFQALAADAGVSLGATRLEETPVRMDATLVRRLIGILVENALRYTPRGGSVDVHVWREAGSAWLEVEDTGIGIDPAERARVGERFFRGRRARAMAPGGSGLGLPIALWVASRHGAAIEFLPRTPAPGTLVRVRFPATPG